MKLKEKIVGVLQTFKKSIGKFPLTIISAIVLTVIYTICLDNYSIETTTLTNISLFIVIFASSTFLIETVLENKIKKKIIYYIIAAIWATVLTYAVNIEEGLLGMSNTIFLFKIERFIICYLIATIVLAIYYNYKSLNKTFEQYVTSTFVTIFKTSLIYGILAIGIAMITAVFVYLILDGESYILVARMEILLFGVYYIPTVLYSFYDQEEEIGKFAKIVIKYVLGTLVIVAFAIIYMYIIKIIFLRDIPSNLIFRILSALFIIGLPVWTMILSFKENTTLDKINRKLPLLFIPFIILQIYSIGTRILSNGITELRYLCLMLIIFEIVYIIIYLTKKEKVSRILLVFLALTVISTIAPYINMFTISNLSQYNNLKIYKQKTEYSEEEKTKIYGAYNYLRHSSIEGKKYIENYLTKDDEELIKKLKNSGTKKSDNGKNIYVDKNINYIEVGGYKKVYKIDSYSYNSSKENRTIDETFSNIEINTQESNYSIEANILPLINEYVNHENEMNNYSEENNELKLDENKKIILERLILEYDDTTKNVSYYNMSGYLLEK